VVVDEQDFGLRGDVSATKAMDHRRVCEALLRLDLPSVECRERCDHEELGDLAGELFGFIDGVEHTRLPSARHGKVCTVFEMQELREVALLE
jgi:hypothetical protein